MTRRMAMNSGHSPTSDEKKRIYFLSRQTCPRCSLRRYTEADRLPEGLGCRIHHIAVDHRQWHLDCRGYIRKHCSIESHGRVQLWLAWRLCPRMQQVVPIAFPKRRTCDGLRLCSDWRLLLRWKLTAGGTKSVSGMTRFEMPCLKVYGKITVAVTCLSRRVCWVKSSWAGDIPAASKRRLREIRKITKWTRIGLLQLLVCDW